MDFFIADLVSLRQIRNLAEEIKSKHNRLDVLINNAGIIENQRKLTEDGYEMILAVNHLAYFLLTGLLLDLLKKSVFLATASELENVTGKYFVDKREASSASNSYVPEVRKKLWEMTERMVGIDFNTILDL